MLEVRKTRPVVINWHVMSLAILNEACLDELPERIRDLMGQAWWEQRLASRGKRHGPAVPVEQACTEVTFQGLDLLRQRWSGNAQPRRGPAEVEFLGDGHEVAQLAQFHDVIVAQWEVLPTSRENAGRGGAGGRRATVDT